MLYLCLFFAPTVLKNDMIVMREIVDRYFPNQWMVFLRPTKHINLVRYLLAEAICTFSFQFEAWRSYSAAIEALSSIVSMQNKMVTRNKYEEEARTLKEGLEKSFETGDIFRYICLPVHFAQIYFYQLSYRE